MRTRARISYVLLAALLASGVQAQRTTPAAKPKALDRTVRPPVGKAPELHVPAWTTSTLSNGAQLVVSERHALPLIAVNVAFVGGANQFEPAGKTGLASFVASMLTEGTTTKSGDDLSNAMQLLGTSITPSIGGESGSIGFTAIRDKFEPALALLADMMLHPTFPNDALERLRARTLVNLQQDRDRTSSVARVVFPKTVYTADHPYGRSMSEESVKAITRDDLAAFHKQYFQPGRAVITVVGDISAADAKAEVEKALAAWSAGGSRPAFTYPAVPAAGATAIYLVDKPGAAQSSVRIGIAGPPRSSPDYYPLRVMSQILGELFQSRLNANIREQKGYSYGVRSNVSFGRGPGPITTWADVVTAKTDSALIEWMKEIRGIEGERPITDEELTAGKAALAQSLPERFSSVNNVAGAIREIYTDDLSRDYYQQFVRGVNAVTKDDVVRVARKYLDPAHLTIVIVGDRNTIEGALVATKIAPIVRLDINGNPIREPVRP
jgi:zinc protease